MEKIKRILFKCGTAVSALALLTAISSVNSACYIFYHQPEIPEDMKRFKK